MRTKIASLCLALCSCAAALADDVDSALVRYTRLDSMQYLQNVVVYARHPYEEVIPAQTLSGKRLEALNSHSVADAVRYFSGVQLKDYGGVGGLKTIDIRSMGTNQMGVFYDGIQIGNAQNGQVDLGRFSLDNVDEIALYNGQKSTIFQPARDFGTAGSVYMNTRHPIFKDGRRNNFNVTLRTGSFGLINPSLRWEHKFSDHVSMLLNTEYTYATGEYHFRYRKRFSDGTMAWDTTAVRHNGDLHAFRAEAALYGVMEQGKWKARAYYYDSERGIPGAIVNNVWYTSQRQWDRNFFLQGSYQQRLGERYELMANAKYAHDYLHYLNPDTTQLYIDNTFWQDELYFSLAQKLNLLPGWDIDLSTDYKWNYLDATLTNHVYPTRHTVLVALATAYTWRRLKGQASLLYSLYHDRSTARNNGVVMGYNRDTRQRLTPAVYLSWQPWEQYDLNLRAFYKRVFRMPTFNDLYYTDIGNITLRPEYATQYNVGVLFQRMPATGFFSGFRFSVDGYYNLITDKIVAVPRGSGQYRWMMMNLGTVKILGLDVSARTTMRLTHELTGEVMVSYTYQRARDYTDPTDTGEGGTYKQQIAYVPWHSGSAVGRLEWRGLDVNYSFIYVGERYQSSANTRANYVQPWYTHDLSASYRFNLGRTVLRLTAEVNNLFNQYYDVIVNYPMPGRNFKFVIKYDF